MHSVSFHRSIVLEIDPPAVGATIQRALPSSMLQKVVYPFRNEVLYLALLTSSRFLYVSASDLQLPEYTILRIGASQLLILRDGELACIVENFQVTARTIDQIKLDVK